MNQSQTKESKTRSIYKGLTWRILATGTTFLLSWLFVKDLSVATTIAVAEFFIKFAIYYLHERAWQRVPMKSNLCSETHLDQGQLSIKWQVEAPTT